MERTLIGNLREHVGTLVLVKAWVAIRRDQGKIVFFDFRDMSGTVQGVILPNQSDAKAVAKDVRPEYVVEIDAIVNQRPEKNVNPKVLNGDIELEIKTLRILNVAQELPFSLGTEVHLDTYFDHLPFVLREQRTRDIFAIQATVIESFRTALRTLSFIEFQAPTLVGADAEGGAAAFKVDYYYHQKAFLATSPQFYKQIMVGVCERAFATPKVFRGEKHSTTRHLSEYCSLDFEMGFIDDHRDVMTVLDCVIRNILSDIVNTHPDAVLRMAGDLPHMPDPIPVLKLRQAQAILGVPDAPDLEPEHERQLWQWAQREHDSDFVFITHYPVSKRPFYTYEDEGDPGFTKSFDLLFRGLEISTGGQRIHHHDTLVERMRSRGLDPAKFAFYLQAFKYGIPPHGGCAIGLERLTARLLNIANIKEATLFPRDLNRIDTLLSDNPVDGR